MNTHNNNKTKAVISDMDGVLVDSFKNFYLAYKQILEKKGVTGFTEDYYRQFFGAKGDYTKRAIERDFTVNLGSTDEFMEKKDNNYLNNALKRTIPFEEPVKALKELSSYYKIAVASSSTDRIVEHSLQTIGLNEYVEAIVPGNHVKEGKPEPETFLLAAERLNIKPENSVVIEDSVPGMNAAYSAGIKCICIIADGIDEKKYDKAEIILRMSELKSNMLIKEVKRLLGD
ncbi:MAG: HAD family hydrolase [Spirochaetota bacterium]